MARTAADVLIETLIDWGVDTVFGLPGDGINGIMESLRTHQDEIRFVQVRHEESAAFAATAYAKFTGRLGVCLATSGPGGLHLTNGLYDAKLDGASVLAITGHHLQRPHRHPLAAGRRPHPRVRGRRRLQHARHERGARRQRRAAWPAGPPSPAAALPTSASRPTSRNARPTPARAGPATCPGTRATPTPPPASLPADATIRRAAELLNSGTKVTILAGQGALGAGAELERIADTLGAPIVKPLLGKAVVPDDSPYTTGGSGCSAPRRRRTRWPTATRC